MLDNRQIFDFINRITDGDNIQLDDAIAHVANITGFTVSKVEDIYVCVNSAK